MQENVSVPRVRLDEHGMPVGAALGSWQPPQHPGDEPLTGTWCHLDRLSSSHSDDLYEAYAAKVVPHDWTYLPYGPFDSREAWRVWLDGYIDVDDPHFRTIIATASGKAVGLASWLRIAPEAGSIEVGHIHFAPALQRRREATEAMFLMMKYAFELGYRRYEWKCDALNARSCRAALRLGFTQEGIFRQAAICKNRNRDTSWFSIIDSEWPARKAALTGWLQPSNFDIDGRQQKPLASFRRAARQDQTQSRPSR